MRSGIAWAGFALSCLCAGAVSGQTWQQRGPAPGLNGQPENIANSPIAGAVEAIVAHPTLADVLWIGTVNGGIFKTLDATAATPSWTAQTDAQGSLSIGDLSLDPTDGSSNTLVAGIGLVSSYARDGGARAGLLRTTNGGTTWTSLSSMAGANVAGVAARGSTILVAVDSFDGGALCSNVGLYRSTNTGTSFSLQTNGGTSSLPCGLSQDLAGDPTDNTRLFAPVTHGGGTVGIYRTDDTGSSWSKVSNGSMDALLATPSKVEIAVGNAGGMNANVFVAICNSGALAGLFYTGDGGATTPTWTPLDLPSTTEAGGFSFGLHPGTQCGLHLSLEADPIDDDVVYIGGDRQPSNNEGTGSGQQFPNSIGASQFGGRLFRVDAGQSTGSQVTPITNCASATTACGGAVRTQNDTAPHADSRDMAFDANGDLIQTDDGGVYKHTDPSGSSGDWFSIIGDLAVVEQHDAAYDSVSDILISGNQDNGTTQQQTTASDDWTTIFGGDGGDVAVAEDDPVANQSTRYLSAQNFGGGNRQVFNSSNAFVNGTFVGLNPAPGSPNPTAQFVTPLAVNAVTPSRILFGGGNGIFESFDRLDTVERISTAQANDLFGGGTMAYGAAVNANALYVASGDDVFVRTGAPPAAVLQTDPDGSTTSLILGVTIDPDDGSAAFAVDFNSVFRTTNGGTSWSDVTGNLGALDTGVFRSLSYVATGGDRLVLGTDKGVFVATEADGFAVWAELGTGMPHAPVFELSYDAADELLMAGTLGRGTWTLDLSSVGGGCSPDDAFEDDDTFGTASSISSGVTQAHKICPVGDEDWVTFTLTQQSEVVLETSGAAGDTVMTLFDGTGSGQIEQDDDGGSGTFSRIDRTCAADPLAAGTYFVRVDEFGNNNEIADYDLDYTLVQSCASCDPLLTFANTTLSTPQTYTAENIVLGPNLTVSGAGVHFVSSQTIEIGDNVSITGQFSARTDASACP